MDNFEKVDNSILLLPPVDWSPTLELCIFYKEWIFIFETLCKTTFSSWFSKAIDIAKERKTWAKKKNVDGFP